MSAVDLVLRYAIISVAFQLACAWVHAFQSPWPLVDAFELAPTVEDQVFKSLGIRFDPPTLGMRQDTAFYSVGLFNRGGKGLRVVHAHADGAYAFRAQECSNLHGALRHQPCVGMVERAVVEPVRFLDRPKFVIRKCDHLDIGDGDDDLHLNAAFQTNGAFSDHDGAQYAGARVAHEPNGRISGKCRNDDSGRNAPL